jgi:toxin ParE1/3/4
MKVIIAPRARSDIAGILLWTHENFGAPTRRRYTKLIRTAIQMLAANPETEGSQARPEIAKICRGYHLFHCRKKAGARGDRIRHPRYFLLYRITAARTVEIGRVLPDSMELEQHQPSEYRDAGD